MKGEYVCIADEWIDVTIFSKWRTMQRNRFEISKEVYEIKSSRHTLIQSTALVRSCSKYIRISFSNTYCCVFVRFSFKKSFNGSMCFSFVNSMLLARLWRIWLLTKNKREILLSTLLSGFAHGKNMCNDTISFFPNKVVRMMFF